MSTAMDTPTVNASQAVRSLADEYIKWRLKDTPEFACFVGVHDYDDRLDDMSLQAYQDRHDHCLNLLQRSEDLEDQLTDHADLFNLQVLKTELSTYIDGYPYKGFLLPLCYLSGIHLDFELLVSWMVFKNTEDYRKILSRLEKLPLQLKQIQELMVEGINKGIVNHLSSLEGVSENLRRFTVDSAEKSPLWKPFETFPESILQEDVDDIRTHARRLITSNLSPAFKKLRLFVKEYELATRPNPGVTTLPNGDALYRQLIRFHTNTSMTPERIHELGKNEMERIEEEMTKIISEVGYDMPVSDFSTMIRNDARFYYTDPKDLLQEVRRLVDEVIAPRLPEVFTTLPKTKLRVVADPSPDGTLAFHQPGSLDGSRPGLYKVNTQLCSAQPKYDLLTMSLHEGNPGHHLHSAYIMESPNMPLFRKFFEDRNYQQAPSRLPLYSAFLEGWALYAESLGFDMKLFDDPYDRYGYYSNEIYRACRLVVDTGLHCFGWTREEAVNYMKQHTALASLNIENEVRRYIALPGQALAYKIGQLKIKELREKATVALGEKFSLKGFHDVVLAAAGPLDLLENEVDVWIRSHDTT